MNCDDLSVLIVQRAQALGVALRERRWTITTAESCTAGGVAYALTAMAGASAWFERGFVTYSNESKVQMLGVSPVYLRDFGAVSEPVARSMALGALAQSNARSALAVTGIAGPGGGLPNKPVGTVCLAWAIRNLTVPALASASNAAQTPWVRTATCHFEGDRAAVRAQTIVSALEGHLALLEQHTSYE